MSKVNLIRYLQIIAVLSRFEESLYNSAIKMGYKSGWIV